MSTRLDLDDLVIKLAEILNITDWNIELTFIDDFLNSNDFKGISTFTDYGSKNATITLNTNFKDEYTDTIIHEMIHIVIQETYIHSVPSMTENYLPPVLLDSLQSELSRSIERIVNSFSKIIRKTLID